MISSGIQPDVAAPGIDILAAYIPFTYPAGTSDFHIVSGTSMSCPHAAGVAALIRAAHPTWSPSAIKSALMTTGKHIDHLLHHFEEIYTKESYTKESYTKLIRDARHISTIIC